MNEFMCSSWIDFQPYSDLLSSLPNELALPVPIPTLYILSFKEIELSYMDMTHERLEKVFRFLIKIKGLRSLRLSFFEHRMKSNELSQLFYYYLPLLVNLRNLEVNFVQKEEFSLKNLEEIGWGLKSLLNLEKLTLFFVGECLIFTSECIYKLFADLPISLKSLCLKFLSKDQVSFESLVALCRIINTKKLKNLELCVATGLFEVYSAFASEYKGDSLKSFKATLNYEEKTLLSYKNMEVFESFFLKFQGLEKFVFSSIFPINLLHFRLHNQLTLSMSLMQNLKFLRVEVGSRNMFICIFNAIGSGKCFNNLLSLELVENPFDFANASQVFCDYLFKFLLPLANQLVTLKILHLRYGKFDELISFHFKYLTTFEIDTHYFFTTFQKFINERRRPLVLTAWVLRNKLNKVGGIFKRKLVLEEILSLFS